MFIFLYRDVCAFTNQNPIWTRLVVECPAVPFLQNIYKRKLPLEMVIEAFMGQYLAHSMGQYLAHSI